MKTNNRQLTINGLRACGWVEVRPAPSSKYTTFSREDGQGRMFVGRSGALRWSRLGKATDSISMTDNKRHRAYRECGNPACHFESTEQAVSAYCRILGGS